MIHKIRHYFIRRKALRLFADKFLFEPLQPLAPQPGQVVNPPTQPQTQFKPELPQQPTQAAETLPPQPVQPPQQPNAPVQPTQIPVQQPPATPASPQPGTVVSPQREILKTLEPMAQAKMDVINRRIQ